MSSQLELFHEERAEESFLTPPQKAHFLLSTMDEMEPRELLNEAVALGLFLPGELEGHWERERKNGQRLAFPSFILLFKNVIREMLQDIADGTVQDGREARVLQLQEMAKVNERVKQVADYLGDTRRSLAFTMAA